VVKDTLVAATRETDRRERHTAVRGLAAWVVVALTLSVAVFGALRGGSGGLALGVSTLAGGATDALQGLGQAVPLGYAFAVGMASAVNPCGFALLPTYLGLYLGSSTLESRPWPAQLARALLVSAAMTGSFVALFGAAGVVLGVAGAAVGPLLPWLSVAVGVLLVFGGGRLLAGRALAAAPAERLADALGATAGRAGFFGYAAYGLAFAFSSLGCTLPLFLAVVGTGLARGGLAAGLEELVLYALGMGAVISSLTVLVALLGGGVLRRVRWAGRFLEPFSAVLVLATGGYIVYYWLSAGGILG
jgi:cytochrome c biogenesis protein CcdA